MKDYIKDLKKKLQTTPNTNSSSSSTIQSDLVQRTVELYLAVLRERGQQPKIKEKDYVIIAEFWSTFKKENPNLIVNKDTAGSFLSFFFYFNQGKVTTNNFFSKKSIQLYRENKESFFYFSSRKRNDNSKFDSFSSDEKNRALYFNKDNSFLHCIETTTLIHPESTHCPTCNNKYDCKALLKDNYPKLYKIRYEDK